MSSNRPLVFELFGQPGAGKTTLARAVGDTNLQSTAQLAAAWRRRPIAAKGMTIAQAIIGGTAVARAAALAVEVPLSRTNSVLRLARLVVKSHWLRSNGGRYLLEEGHLQELWSIFYSAGRTRPEPGRLVPLIQSLYQGLDARIFFVDADIDRLFDRIRNRDHGKSRFDRLTARKLRQQFEATAELPHRLAHAAQMAGLKVHRLDGSRSVDNLLDQLRVATVQADSIATEHR